MKIKSNFRNVAAFGKRIEYWIIGLMLKEGLDVYIPLVDDHAVDAIVKRKDGSTALIQIKARSRTADHAALFAGIPHEEIRPDYWFIFYSEQMDSMWIMSSQEFIQEASQNKTGKNKGKYSICFTRKERWSKYISKNKNFDRIAQNNSPDSFHLC
jgi:hypothetical protein